MSQRPLILLVDDEFVIRNLIQRYFSNSDYEVATAESGEKALEFIQKATPDLILMDVYMPGMGGLKTLREINTKNPTIPVIMLTAVEDAQIAQMALNYGARDYLTKPIELHTLKRVLQTHFALFF